MVFKMEVFVATKDYVKEREDMLSFSEGDKFRIASKADSKWWSAYAVKSGDYGYVPSHLLEVGRRTTRGITRKERERERECVEEL